MKQTLLKPTHKRQVSGINLILNNINKKTIIEIDTHMALTQKLAVCKKNESTSL